MIYLRVVLVCLRTLAFLEECSRGSVLFVILCREMISGQFVIRGVSGVAYYARFAGRCSLSLQSIGVSLEDGAVGGGGLSHCGYGLRISELGNCCVVRGG
jgi:hypothetical protein